MLANTDLMLSLTELDGMYNAAMTLPVDAQKRICKYALLELCGWMEQAQDFVVNSCIAKIPDADLRDIVEDKLRRTYGFDKKDFLPILGLTIGFQNFAVVRANVAATTPDFDIAMNIFASLRSPRNEHAHTHFSGGAASAATLRAPSLVIVDAQKVYSGLAALQAELVSEQLA